MSNYNERNSKPTEKLTVAGIAAVIVVGVFVVCVILILAKSLFPSNNDSTPEGVYTGTKSSQAEVQSKAESKADSSVADIVDSAVTDSQSDSSDVDSQADTSSVAEGETATLTQTAYLRAANDENSEPILSINGGETVTVIERPADSEYVHVQYLTYDGWVWNGYLA